MRNNTNKRLLAFVLSSVLLLTVLIGGLALMLFSSNSGANDPMSELFATVPSNLTIGDKEKLSAEAKSLSGITSAIDGVTWKSLDDNTFIDREGNLSATKVGLAKVEASYEGFTSVREINISDIEYRVNGTVHGDSKMEKGSFQTLEAEFADYDLNVTPVEWTTNNNTAVQVDRTQGVATAVGLGVATITARVSNTNDIATITITVGDKEAPISSIDLGADKTIGKGMTTTIGYTTTPENANVQLKFTSDTPKVATVDQNTGVVTGLKAGKTVILATVVGNPEISDTIVVEVVDQPVSSIVISGAKTTTVGALIELTSKVEPGALVKQGAYWSTLNTNFIILRDENGNKIQDDEMYEKVWVEAYQVTQEGFSVSITATRDEQVATHSLTIGERLAAKSVKITQGDFTMAGGQTVKLTATVDPVSADQTVVWSTDMNNTVSIDSDGTIHTIKEGKATITARSYNNENPVEDSIIVTVSGTDVSDLTGVKITNKVLRVVVGGTLNMTSETTPAGFEGTVKWESNQVDVATVDLATGKLTAHKVGTTQILARVSSRDDLTDAVTIQVIPTPDATSIEIQGNSYNGAFGSNLQQSAAVRYGEIANFKAVLTPTGVVENVGWSFDPDEAKTNGIAVNILDNKDGIQQIQFGKLASTTGTEKDEIHITATHYNSGYNYVSETILIKLAERPTATNVEIKGPEGKVGETSIDSGADITLTARAFVTGKTGVEIPSISAGVKQEFVWRSMNENIAALVVKDAQGNDVLYNGTNGNTGETPIQQGGDIQLRAQGIIGTATIRAYIPNTQTIYAEIKVTVNVANSAVKYTTIVEKSKAKPNPGQNTASGKTAKLYADQKLELVAFGFDGDPKNGGQYVDGATFQWWTNDLYSAVVDQNGVVTQVAGAKQGTEVHVFAQAIGTQAIVDEFVLKIDTTNFLLYDYVQNGVFNYEELNNGAITPKSIKYSAIANNAPQTAGADAYWSAAVMSAYIDAQIITARVDADVIKAYKGYTDLQTALREYAFDNSSTIQKYHSIFIYTVFFGADNKIGTILDAILTPTQENIDAALACFDQDLFAQGLPEFGVTYNMLLDKVKALKPVANI